MPATTKGARREQLARYVREQTGDGQDLVDFWVAIQRNQLRDKDDKPVKVTLRMQMDAAQWLGDRGWGKAPQEISVEAGIRSEDQEALDEWDLDKLQAGITILEAGQVVTSD